jgi:hypothetical protein
MGAHRRRSTKHPANWEVMCQQLLSWRRMHRENDVGLFHLAATVVTRK